MAVPKVAAIHDLSGLGRCSLTVAIPVLAAMGVQACPLPTAVLSSQTGFGGYACRSLSHEMEASARQWQTLDTRFAGIYTGFLVDEQQCKLVEAFIHSFRKADTLVLVDPVLGDSGQLYPVFGPTMCEAVKALVGMADVITPNLTEACLLTGTPYQQALEQPDTVWQMAEQLAAMGPSTIVISGIHEGDSICTVAYIAGENRRVSVRHRRIGGAYSGTGDILASILCGDLVQGNPVQGALEKAATLFERGIAQAHTDGTDPNEGIAFEPHLHLLYLKKEAKP